MTGHAQVSKPSKEGSIAYFVGKLPEMEVAEGKEDYWRQVIEANKDDGYSRYTVETAESLAKVLQTVRESPGDREELVLNVLQMVDSVGLTRFQVECIYSLLRKIWKYGGEFFPTEGR